MNINAKTIITGLFGLPVEHSLSPDMHNSAFKELQLNYCYIAMPVHPDSLSRAIEGVRAMNFRGVNITVPHKEKVGRISQAQLEEIANVKEPDLNSYELDQAVRIIAGSARSMGIETEGV